MSSNNARAQGTLKCPQCEDHFTTTAAFRNHIRWHRHDTRSAPPPPSPPSKLMSARSMNDDSVGIFDFPSVLADERINDDNYIQYDYDDHDDVDSYFSDAAYDYEYDDNIATFS